MDMQLAQLLKESKRNSLAAQRCLYEHFAQSMFLLCRRYLKTDETAEEVMMTGFLKFFQSLPSFQYVNDEALKGWIKKIMINECLMFLRSTNSFLMVSADDYPETGETDTIISGLTAGEIFSLITRLPAGYRTVFNLYVIEGMTHREIASALGISEGTSKSQLSKARGMLQQMLVKINEEYGCRKTK
jgi:RNA polymerase sigma factor (sigma-70 family)